MTYLVMGDPPSGGVVHFKTAEGPAPTVPVSTGSPGVPATAVALDSADRALVPAWLVAVTT
jgi:hypothetical protein